MKKYQVAIIGTNIGAKHYEDFQKVKERFNVHTSYADSLTFIINK